jgi:TRAP transporter TAXI family solute receptor
LRSLSFFAAVRAEHEAAVRPLGYTLYGGPPERLDAHLEDEIGGCGKTHTAEIGRIRGTTTPLCQGPEAAYPLRNGGNPPPKVIKHGRRRVGRQERNAMNAHITRIGLAAGLSLALAGTAAAVDIKLMTGPQGGSWIPLGGQMKDMWEKSITNASVQTLPGAGIANVRGIEEGKADVGFANSISTVDAVAGKPPFNKPHNNVCNVATLYPQYFQVVVRADAGVNSVKDLKGKAFATQPRGNTAEEITKHILQVNGLSYNDLKMSFLSYSDAVTQVQDGHAVGFALGTTIPASAVMDLASARDIKLLELGDQLDAMRKINPGYTLVNVPKGTYPKIDRDVKVIGYATHIVASCKLPEDTVYAMTKALSQKVEDMSRVVSAIKGLDVKGMAEDIGVPFHPGAAKFYKEAGVTVKAR